MDAAIRLAARGSGPGLPTNPRPNPNTRGEDIISTIISTYSTDSDVQYSPSEYTDESSSSPFLPIQGTEEDADSHDDLEFTKAGRVVNRNDSGYSSSVERPHPYSKFSMANQKGLSLSRDSFAFVSEKAGISRPFEFVSASIPTPPLSGRIASDGPVFRMSRPLSRSSKPAALNLRSSNGSTAATLAQHNFTPLTAIPPPVSELGARAHDSAPLSRPLPHMQSPDIPKTTGSGNAAIEGSDRLSESQKNEMQTTWPIRTTSTTPYPGKPLPAHPAANLEAHEMRSFFSTRERENRPDTSRRLLGGNCSSRKSGDGMTTPSYDLPPTPPSLSSSPELFSSRQPTKAETVVNDVQNIGVIDQRAAARSASSSLVPSEAPVSTVQPSSPVVPPPHDAGSRNLQSLATSPFSENLNLNRGPLAAGHVLQSTELLPPALSWQKQGNDRHPQLRTAVSSAPEAIASIPVETSEQPPLLPQTTFQALPSNPRPNPTTQRNRLQVPASLWSGPGTKAEPPLTPTDPASVIDMYEETIAPTAGIDTSVAGSDSTATSSQSMTTAPEERTKPPVASTLSPDLLTPQLPQFSMRPSLATLVEQRPPPPASRLAPARRVRPSMVECHADHSRWHGPRRKGCAASCMLCHAASDDADPLHGDGLRQSTAPGNDEDTTHGTEGQGVHFFQCVYCALWVCEGCKARVDAAMPGRRGTGYGVGVGAGLVSAR